MISIPQEGAGDTVARKEKMGKTKEDVFGCRDGGHAGGRSIGRWSVRPQWRPLMGKTTRTRGGVLSSALSPSTRRRKLLAWSCGENDSSPSDASVHLKLRTSHSWRREPLDNLRALNRLRTQVGRSRVDILKSGDIRTNRKFVTVASGRPCNIYWSAAWWTLPALLMTSQRLMASPWLCQALGGHDLTCDWWKDKNEWWSKNKCITASSLHRCATIHQWEIM